MAKRLDVSALIQLVGRDKLEEELNRTAWYFIITQENQVIHFERLHLDRNINPIEWLIYNNRRLLMLLATRLLENESTIALKILEVVNGRKTRLSGYGGYEDYLIIEDAIIRLDAMEEIPALIIDTIWSYVKEMGVTEFRPILSGQQQWDESVNILDGDGSNYLTNNIDALVDEL